MKSILYPLYVIVIFLLLWKYSYDQQKHMTVCSFNSGLNNKLEPLLSYLYRANKENKKLKFVWINDNDCPVNFEDVFKSIDNVEIINKNQSCDFISWKGENNNYLKENYYSLLQPIDLIQKDIDETKQLLNSNYIACHLRRTDGWNHRYYKKARHTDEEYMNFINQYPIDLKIYIATDCRLTQQKFIDAYGDRLIYKKIEISENLRQTSIQDAVKDMYVCAGSKYFMRSPGTFSDGIIRLKNLNVK